jgi:hypothetical protein
MGGQQRHVSHLALNDALRPLNLLRRKRGGRQLLSGGANRGKRIAQLVGQGCELGGSPHAKPLI